jgi:hypothetical protein
MQVAESSDASQFPSPSPDAGGYNPFGGESVVDAFGASELLSACIQGRLLFHRIQCAHSG